MIKAHTLKGHLIAMRCCFRRALLPLVLLIANWTDGESQISIGLAPHCGTCRITLRRTLVFGDTAGPGELPPEIRSIKGDASGRFMIGGYLSEPPFLYDQRGRFLSRIGAKGAGPGELKVPVLADLRGDTAWIVDGVNARVTGFQVGRAGRAVANWRTVGMSGILSAVRTGDGAVVANVMAASRQDFGIPLLRLTPDGARHPMGEVAGVLMRSQARLLMRALAPARAGGVWAAHYDAYRIERFDSMGTLVVSLQRSVPWFPDGDGSVVIPTPESPPKPTIFSLIEDEGGLLWIFTAIADADYQRGLRPREDVRSPDQARFAMADFDRYLDTVVDIIDPATGQLVASQRFDEFMMFALSAGRDQAVAAGLRVVESGHQLVVVYSVSLAH